MTQAVAILGGTFDPPHLGHAGMIRFALEAGLPEVWVFPVFRNRDGKTPAPFEQRLQMCARLALPFGASVKVRDDERVAGTNGLTVELLRHLRARHPYPAFRLLIGPDVAEKLPRWPGAAEILQLAPPLICPAVEGPDGRRLSSRDVRVRIQSADPVTDLLPAEVQDFVMTEKLYFSGPASGAISENHINNPC